MSYNICKTDFNLFFSHENQDSNPIVVATTKIFVPLKRDLYFVRVSFNGCNLARITC